MVQSSKFPPQGIRGQGSAFPGFAHGTSVERYIKEANETTLVCIQIETRAGLESVEAIAAVPGVGRSTRYDLPNLQSLNTYTDMLFIGPNDLALSILGYVPARGDEPLFLDAIDKIIAAARKHGKWVGRLSNNGLMCKDHLQVFDTVALSYDVRALQNWYKVELSIARS